MTIFCLNVVISLTTTTVIVLFDVLGDSDEAENWRNFLNRAFLIFPQHALSDGLVTICKNFLAVSKRNVKFIERFQVRKGGTSFLAYNLVYSFHAVFREPVVRFVSGKTDSRNTVFAWIS